MKLNTRQIAFISVFAALQVVISRLPGIPLIGVESGKIEPTVLLMPVIGIILGPWVGGLAAFIGNFIAWLIPSTSFFGLLMLPTAPVGAIVAGLLARMDAKSDWKVAALMLLVLNALWFASPPGMIVPYYPLLHLAALALILVFRHRIAKFVRSDDKGKLSWGTAIASFSSVMANHMTGTLIFIGSVGLFIELKGIKDAIKNVGFYWLKSGLPKEDPTGLGAVFELVFPITVAERLVMTAITVPIGVGILYALRKSGIVNI
ncbi:MAG: ECF transporter S component [Candidatus Bathyarchaeota archaeon]|nr:ECF transporter S component [Candidatus Bathyarchaeota archaeon]